MKWCTNLLFCQMHQNKNNESMHISQAKIKHLHLTLVFYLLIRFRVLIRYRYADSFYMIFASSVLIFISNYFRHRAISINNSYMH